MYVVVLIPLNSGLVFVYQVRRDVGGKRCLNPFEFRAGICFAARIDSEALAGLNPFEFRAGICLARLLGIKPPSVLIPLNSGLVFVWAFGMSDSSVTS